MIKQRKRAKPGPSKEVEAAVSLYMAGAGATAAAEMAGCSRHSIYAHLRRAAREKKAADAAGN